MQDSASSHTITIIRDAGTPKEYRQEGIRANIQGNGLVIDGSANINLEKYDEIHANHLDEPYVVTSIRSRKLSDNRTAYEVEIPPPSVYQTTHINAITTAGRKHLPKDTLCELRRGDFPGTVKIKLQFPGQKGHSRFYNIPIHDHILEIPVKLVFLCHANEDKETVERIGDNLYQDGFLTWFDKKDLLPGDDWEEKIKDAIERSDYVLVFLSGKSCSKVRYVQKEMKYALEQRDLRPKGHRYIIPILVEECEPPRDFRSIQWSRMWEDGWYEKLKLALDSDF